MALQVDRFVTPEQDFAGLYRYSGRLEQNRLRQEQEKQAAAGRKAASDKYFANYLDPKEWFTGTVADGVIHNMIGEALGQAFKLSADGASDNQIFTAISPIVNRANEYSAKAKNIQLQKKQALDIVGKRKGVDVIKFSNEFDDEVFMETDPITGVKKMRDLSLIDPSQNYADKVLSTRDVFNTEGFDEFISKSKSVTGNLSTKLTDAKKGMRAVKLSVTAPEYMEPVIVNGVFQQRFQPRHEVFTDNGEVVEEPEFDIDGNPVIGSNGKQSKTPVKMVTKDDWGPLLRNPGTGAYLRQEVKKYANKLGVDPAGPQAEHFGRALAWKLIDQSTQSRGTYSEAVEQKAQPIIINNNSGTTSKTPTQIDLREYPDVAGGGKDITNLMQGVKVTGLPNGKTLLAEKVYYNPTNQRVTFKEYAERDESGAIITGGGEKTVSLTTFLQNIKSNNPGTDMKFLEGLRNPITGAAPTTDNNKDIERWGKLDFEASAGSGLTKEESDEYIKLSNKLNKPIAKDHLKTENKGSWKDRAKPVNK